jgi:asparagine synthase (glutamine-hydrolysing)
MSGIAGIWQLDGRPAAAAALRAMAAAAPHRAPDGVDVWTSDCVGLCRLRLETTPEERGDTQPVVDRFRGLSLLFDGRLDNRDDVIQALGLRDPTIPDARVALEACARWGSEAPERLLGDFAFALWEARPKRLTCVRDALGVRPLYYASVDGLFAFASEPAQLLALQAVPRRINEGAIAELLANVYRTREETLYRNVRRLPPACCLVVEECRVQVRRYWTPLEAPEVRCASDAEYEERFRELFVQAVTARLRASGPVGAYLSGGLDSSSVVAVAAEIERENGRPAPDAHALVFPDHAAADERPYIDDVARMHALRCHRHVAAPFDGRRAIAEAARRVDLPDAPNDAMADGIRAALAERGAAVVLTGIGGDYGLTGTYFHYADLLRRFALPALVRRSWLDARTPELGWVWGTFVSAGLWPALPEAVKHALRPLARRARRAGLPDWIDPAFARQAGLRDRLYVPPPPRPRSFASAEVARTFAAPYVQHVLEAFERGSAGFGLVDRHPFLDRRLVEFAVGLPEDQRWRRETKSLLRRALHDRLPRSVRERQTKGEFAHVVADAFETLGGERFWSRLHVADAGWVDPAALARRYQRMLARRRAGDLRYADETGPLWAVAAIELWWRAEQGAEAGNRRGLPASVTAR